MLKKLSLALLSLCSLCFAMSRGPQQRGGRYVADRLRAAWKRKRDDRNDMLMRLYWKNEDVMSKEREKIARAYANISQQRVRNDETVSNAIKEFNRKSLFEKITGKRTYFDKQRRQNALETMRKASNQWETLKHKEVLLNERKRSLEQKAKDMFKYYQNLGEWY
jgi:hypothetical protein